MVRLEHGQGNGLGIGILGHYGNDNLGDEAIIQAVIENLRQKVPAAQITCFSVNPANTSRRHGVPAHAVSRHNAGSGMHRPATLQPPTKTVSAGDRALQRLKDVIKSVPGVRSVAAVLRSMIAFPGNLVAESRFIRQSYAHLREIDLLLIAGSNQFLDNFGGPWAFPYAMLKWAWLGRAAKARVAFVSIGAGPLSSPASFLFVRLAMLAADAVSFRDEASRKLVVCGWAGKGARICPDLAFSLGNPVHPEQGERAGRPTIGINPMPWNDRRYWYQVDDDAYRNYVGQLAEICVRLGQRKHPWFMYSTQPKDGNVINDVLDMLVRRGVLPAESAIEKSFNPETVGDLVDRLAATDILIATRFHGIVLSLAAGRPAIGVCYHRKIADVLEETGLSGFHVPIGDLEPAAIIAMVESMELNYGELQGLVRKRANEYRRALDEQYDQLLDLVPDSRKRGALSVVSGNAVPTIQDAR